MQRTPQFRLHRSQHRSQEFLPNSHHHTCVCRSGDATSSEGWWSCQLYQLVKDLWGWETPFMNMVSHAIRQRFRHARDAHQMRSVCERSVRCCQDLPSRPLKVSMPTQNDWKQKNALASSPLQGAHKGSGDVPQRSSPQICVHYTP